MKIYVICCNDDLKLALGTDSEDQAEKIRQEKAEEGWKKYARSWGSELTDQEARDQYFDIYYWHLHEIEFKIYRGFFNQGMEVEDL